MEREDVSFPWSASGGEARGRLLRPDDAWCLYVFAHGAGAGMDHGFMADLAGRLGGGGVATFRFDFPYMMAERRRPPDPPRVLMATVRAAVEAATGSAPDLPLLAGGKSMGGRMTSMAQAEGPLPGVRALAFFGFPLHPPGKEATTRGDHLRDVDVPMLFLQGTRDKLADATLLRGVLRSVDPAPRLHVVDGADHGFHVLKRSGRTDHEVRDELCDVFIDWARTTI
ncbi:MAG: alpha/beta family hydrolase [Longimicrobiales bacterium]|nr:alpha/beta family hydrolase [Longimicrobiales bacterium]